MTRKSNLKWNLYLVVMVVHNGAHFGTHVFVSVNLCKAKAQSF